MKRFRLTDAQDGQRLTVVAIATALMFYQYQGGDIEKLMGDLAKAVDGGLVVWALVLKPPPKKYDDERVPEEDFHNE